jgi:hypothetical protein
MGSGMDYGGDVSDNGAEAAGWHRIQERTYAHEAYDRAAGPGFAPFVLSFLAHGKAIVLIRVHVQASREF